MTLRLSAKQLQMLRDYNNDLEATDICDFGGPFDWHNRERVINALFRKGLLSEAGVTEAGHRVLATHKVSA